MAKKTTTELTTNLEKSFIGLNIQAGTQEVIDIKIAQLESELDAQIATLQKQATELNTTVQTAQKEIEKLTKAFGESKWKTTLDTATSAITALGIKCQGRIETQHDPKTRTITCQPTMNGIGYHFHVPGAKETYTYTNEMITITNTMEQNQTKLQELYKQITKLKQQLAAIPKYERKIRAVIGKTKLEESEEGRALLQKVMNINLLPE